MADLSIRIDFGPKSRIGPGKIALLEKIEEHGSIAAGGRALGMSYRRAWGLIDNINAVLGQPVVTSKIGGQKGGGAALTSLGITLISRFRAIERAAKIAARRHLTALETETKAKTKTKK